MHLMIGIHYTTVTSIHLPRFELFCYYRKNIVLIFCSEAENAFIHEMLVVDLKLSVPFGMVFFSVLDSATYSQECISFTMTLFILLLLFIIFFSEHIISSRRNGHKVSSIVALL